MTKKLLVILCLLGSVSIVGCGKEEIKETKEIQKEETTTEKESTETETEIQKETITTGTLKEYTGEELDSYGNKEALFVDVHGNEFIAIISKDTQVDTLEVGKEYEVYHSNIQTNSLPGKFPEVSKIIKK